MRALQTVLLLMAVALLGGCARSPRISEQPGPGAPEVQSASVTDEQAAKRMKITAYINVTSGCQAPTVELLSRLAAEHQAQVELEIVDFGSSEGSERWRRDGLDCMTLLFDGSPVLRFPGRDGTARVVVFFMPAGFSWTHEDLQDAFVAIAAGKVETLTEEQARQELEPQAAQLSTEVRQQGSAATVVVNGTAVLKLRAGDKTAADRARAAKAAIDAWAAEPIHPSQLSVANRSGKVLLLAKGKPLVGVAQADLQAAGVRDAKQLGTEWLGALRNVVVEAMDAAEKP